MIAAPRWLRRIFVRDKPDIPEELWQHCVGRLAFLERLNGDERIRLKSLCETFLQRKAVSGAAGLEVTNEMAVMIAIQACLPVLNLSLDLYADMPAVIVYPSEFIVPQSEVDEAGVVHEWHEPLAGEALAAGGAVVLSWEDVEDAASLADAYNVVIHEFAHKLDMGRSDATGRPRFLAGFHQEMVPQEWTRVFSEAYEDFCRRVDHIDRRSARAVHASRHDVAADLYDSLPLDPYAAHNPAEFFAVASEVFFLNPEPLAEDYPEVYTLLAQYYKQETLRHRGQE